MTDNLFRTMVIEKRPDGTTRYELDPNKQDEELQQLIDKKIIHPTDHVAFTMPVPVVAEAQPLPQRLMYSEAVDKYITYRKKKAEKRHADYDEKAARDPFKLLAEYLRKDKPVDDITEEDAEDFEKKFRLLPAVRTGSNCLGKTFNQLIKIEDVERLSENTCGLRLGAISGMFTWLNESNTLKCSNHFFGMADKKVMRAEADIKKRQAFNDADLTKVFNHRIWTEHDYKTPWEYWIPLLIVYSGIRVKEAAQLERKDIIVIDGIQCISVNDRPTKDEPDTVWEIAPKRVKTANSIREIPVHSRLIELGFLRFVQSIQTGRLFPDITPTAKKISAKPCKRFNEELLIEIGVKVAKLKTFYSFRHTMMNELRKKKINLEDRGQLAGHAIQQSHKTTARYGDLTAIEEMQAIIEQLTYRDTLQNIRPWA